MSAEDIPETKLLPKAKLPSRRKGPPPIPRACTRALPVRLDDYEEGDFTVVDPPRPGFRNHLLY